MSNFAAIHVARQQAGLDEETARDLYQRETGKRSLRAMSPGEQVRVLQALRNSATGPAAQLDGPYAKKLIALWLDGWNLGVFADRRHASLLAFVKRQTGIEHTRFLRDAHQAQAVVEALKKWLTREAGVQWSQHADLMDDVIEAQAQLLGLYARDAAGEDSLCMEAFRAWRRDDLDRGGKIAAMQLFGRQIRDRR